LLELRLQKAIEQELLVAHRHITTLQAEVDEQTAYVHTHRLASCKQASMHACIGCGCYGCGCGGDDATSAV